MGPCILRLFYSVTVILVFAASGFASPVNFKLLPLVPAGAQIVAGFQNPHDPGVPTGRVLLTTHNNRLDLDDWISLTGVDSTKVFDEVIEVAMSSDTVELQEHLLLVAGHFDRARIFRSAEQNGAAHVSYLGETALLIKPYAREQKDMMETRWLIILNDQTGIFGTPAMVQLALQRYGGHYLADPALAERLSRLRSDITSWNVLLPPSKTKKDMGFVQPHGAWSQLLDGADLVIVGTHFGSKIRMDVVVDDGKSRGAAYFTEKAGYFAAVFSVEASSRGDLSAREQPELRDLRVEKDRMQGSIVLSPKQFYAWRGREVSRNLAFLQAAHGTPGD
jgi:hypothetical protein